MEQQETPVPPTPTVPMDTETKQDTQSIQTTAPFINPDPPVQDPLESGQTSVSEEGSAGSIVNILSLLTNYVYFFDNL